MIARRYWLLIPALLAAFGCSEAPKEAAAKKEPAKPPEPVTGRYAFYQMFPAARAWAVDVQPIQITSIPLKDVPAAKGKYGAWQCVFVSPGKGRMKTYSYSVIEAGGSLHQGVFALPDERFSGSLGQAKPFLVAALKIDSDEAYETAVKKSEDYMKKFPNTPIMFQLELTPRFPDPAWRVIWGESVGSSNHSIFVDATTGAYLATAR
ncbi:MAG: hypothetical protein IANPNBLG_03147 [Bryobacteraceae bacterium]|nr:hypothetical protein [Bryobacteraceae bacterium]